MCYLILKKHYYNALSPLNDYHKITGMKIEASYNNIWKIFYVKENFRLTNFPIELGKKLKNKTIQTLQLGNCAENFNMTYLKNPGQ